MTWLSSLVGWRAGAAAFALGVSSAAALPPLHVIPVLLIAIPGLLALIAGSASSWMAARRGFLFGLGHHIFGLYWITEAILLESARYWWLVPFAVPALSALLALFIAVPAGLVWRIAPGWRRAAALAGLWTLFDLLRQYLGTGFPWNPFGSVWAIPGPAGDIMIQPAAWVGTPGLTLATVLLAAAPTLSRQAQGAAALAIVVWAALGIGRLARDEPVAPGLTVVLVQGNVTQGVKWNLDAARLAFDRYLALTRAAMAGVQGPSVVIWPETSSTPYVLPVNPAARAAILAAAAPARAVIAGTLSFTKGEPSRDPDNLPLNTLLAMGADGALATPYSKWHLVPFGEFAPSWVPFAIQIVPGRFGFGAGPATLHLPGLPAIGPMICYEVIFPGQVIDGHDRPAWIVNITNDAWFGNSTGPRQHLAAARMRAVEEGLPLMRAANTGISAGFDSRGRELGRTDMNVATTLVIPLPGARPPTSFSRGGLAIPGILASLLVGIALSRSRLPPRLEKRFPSQT